MSGPTPTQILKHYQDSSPSEMVTEVERIASLGTKDALRLLAYMTMHAARVLQATSRAAGTDDEFKNLAETVRSQ